jgi:hypothetical protein
LNNALHPALAAWERLSSDPVNPDRVSRIKRRAEGAVYRLEGAGPGGADVIAKRCQKEKFEVERLVYDAVYPCLPIPTLQFYGSVEDGSGFCWLFLEDVGQEPYQPNHPAHRRLAAHWFGTLHASPAALELESQLPARDPDHYRSYLDRIMEELPRVPARHAVGKGGRKILDEIYLSCKSLERDWKRLDAFCAEIPRTLVHGDCLAKNVRLRRPPTGAHLVAFDWGGAGWGLLGTDLGLLGLPYSRHAPPPADLDTYQRTVGHRWPGLDTETVRQLPLLGQLFWSLKVIRLEIPAFDYEWAKVGDTLVNFRIYSRSLTDAVERSSWARLQITNE